MPTFSYAHGLRIMLSIVQTLRTRLGWILRNQLRYQARDLKLLEKLMATPHASFLCGFQ